VTTTLDHTATESSPYVLGRTRAEHDRLANQAAALAPCTEGLLDAVGIAAGTSCLDVGCGTGSVMAMLARRAGDHGPVVGIDVDNALGATPSTSSQHPDTGTPGGVLIVQDGQLPHAAQDGQGVIGMDEPRRPPGSSAASTSCSPASCNAGSSRATC
jgi:protein-L-isoaspartate O-methyltransferase